MITSELVIVDHTMSFKYIFIPCQCMCMMHKTYAKRNANIIWSLKWECSVKLAAELNVCIGAEVYCYLLIDTPNTCKDVVQGAIWPSLSPCTVINPILLTYLLVRKCNL